MADFTNLMNYVQCNLYVFVQLKVRPQDLQLCLETSSGVDASGQYQLGDMVQLE